MGTCMGRGLCSPGSHRGGAPTTEPIPPPNRRSTRPGCEGVLPGGGLAVAFGVVGLPAPGVGAHGFEAEFGAPAEFFGGEAGVGVAAGDIARAAVGED